MIKADLISTKAKEKYRELKFTKAKGEQNIHKDERRTRGIVGPQR